MQKEIVRGFCVTKNTKYRRNVSSLMTIYTIFQKFTLSNQDAHFENVAGQMFWSQKELYRRLQKSSRWDPKSNPHISSEK